MEKNFAGGARSNEEKVPDPAYTCVYVHMS